METRAGVLVTRLGKQLLGEAAGDQRCAVPKSHRGGILAKQEGLSRVRRLKSNVTVAYGIRFSVDR
jgi:hypothetical protein